MDLTKKISAILDEKNVNFTIDHNFGSKQYRDKWIAVSGASHMGLFKGGIQLNRKKLPSC